MAPPHYRCEPVAGAFTGKTVALCDGLPEEYRGKLISKISGYRVNCPRCKDMLARFAEKPTEPLADDLT